MMKIRIAGFLFLIFMIVSHNVAAFDVRKNLLQDHKKNFDLKFTLYNGETITNLMPSLKGNVSDDPDVLKHTKYLHVEGVYKGDAIAAYLTINIKSPNNKQLKSSNYHLLLDRLAKFHEIIYVHRPVMATTDEEAIIEYEITDVWYK